MSHAPHPKESSDVLFQMHDKVPQYMQEAVTYYEKKQGSKMFCFHFKFAESVYILNWWKLLGLSSACHAKSHGACGNLLYSSRINVSHCCHFAIKVKLLFCHLYLNLSTIKINFKLRNWLSQLPSIRWYCNNI